MAVTDESSKLLERPYAMHVLVHLKKHIPMTLVELSRSIKADQSALERRVHELTVAGMIRMHENAKQMLNISLTPYGRDVANWVHV